MLSLAQKIAIRRHARIPFAGTAQAGRLLGVRFLFFREDLEYKMNNLQAPEEQLLTGVSLGSFRIDGRPTVGDVLTYTITDATQTTSVSYTVQQSDLGLQPNPTNPSESSPLYAIALNSATALTLQLQQYGYSVVGVMPADLLSPQFLPPYFAEVVVSSSASTAFTLSASVSSGATTNLYVEAQGAVCPIRAQVTAADTGLPVVQYGLINLCDALDMAAAIPNLSLTYQMAGGGAGGGVTFRPDEIVARTRQYKYYVREMLRVLGGEQYVRELFGGNSSSSGASA